MEIVRGGFRPSADASDTDSGQRDWIVGRSHAITRVVQRIQLVAQTRSTVLITGETGTGKELVARAVHYLGAERGVPFVKVNCAAIPESLLESELFGHVRGAFTGATTAKRGKFALAHRGSIFLDEIGTMNLALQAKLLRVLQEREIEPLGAERTERVDVRVIAATNRDLLQMVDAGLFQEDLYYRLDVIPIDVPPLRERLSDLPLLVEHFVEKHARRIGKAITAVDDRAMAGLMEHHWPGNVRELENVIERAVVLSGGPMIGVDAVVLNRRRTQATLFSSLNLHQNVEWIERETIRRALEATPVQRQAARALGITPRALVYYLGKYPGLRQRPSSERRSPGSSVQTEDARCADASPRKISEMRVDGPHRCVETAGTAGAGRDLRGDTENCLGR